MVRFLIVFGFGFGSTFIKPDKENSPVGGKRGDKHTDKYNQIVHF
jgi:hypothetical protein